MDLKTQCQLCCSEVLDFCLDIETETIHQSYTLYVALVLSFVICIRRMVLLKQDPPVNVRIPQYLR